MPNPVQARRKAPIDRGPLHLRTGDKDVLAYSCWSMLDGPLGGYIGGENGRETAFYPLSALMLLPRLRLVANSSRPETPRPSQSDPR